MQQVAYVIRVVAAVGLVRAGLSALPAPAHAQDGLLLCFVPLC
jgi:hypothetical protein